MNTTREVVSIVASHSFTRSLANEKYLYNIIDKWIEHGYVKERVDDTIVFDNQFCEYVRFTYPCYFQPSYVYQFKELRLNPSFGNLCVSKPACVNCRSFPRRPCSMIYLFLKRALNQDLARIIMNMIG